MGAGVNAHNSHSYAAMRMSQQAFSSNNNVVVNSNNGTNGGYNANVGASNALMNQSMGLPLQQTVNSSIELNNSAALINNNNPLNNTSGVVVPSRPH